MKKPSGGDVGGLFVLATDITDAPLKRRHGWSEQKAPSADG